MRLLDLIFYLLKCSSKVTIKELAKTFNVSTKTIQRDLDKLSILGIPIIIYRGKDGGVEIDKNYIIAKQVLKQSDYCALITSLYIGEHLSGSIHEASLIDKFRLMDPNKCSDIINHLQKRLIIDLPYPNFDLESELCQIINQALDNRAFIKLKINHEMMEVLPISYVLKPEGLCLYCYTGEYLLIQLAHICEANLSSKICTDIIIDYNDNKEKIKFI